MQYIIKKLFVIFFVFIYQVVNPLAAKGGGSKWPPRD